MDGGSKVYVHDKRLMCRAHDSLTVCSCTAAAAAAAAQTQLVLSICQKYRHLFHDI